MTSKYLIYALVDPRTTEWRYIGKNSSGLKRPKSHSANCWLKRTPNTHRTHWIQLLKRIGLQYEVVVLEEFDSGDKLSAAEIEWISEAKRQGVPLTNHTDGGEGLLGRVHSKETKLKMSLAATGKPKSAQQKINMSLANLGKTPSEETRVKMINSHKGKPFVDSLGVVWRSAKGCARALGVSNASIRQVLKGKKPTCKGRTFKYI